MRMNKTFRLALRLKVILEQKFSLKAEKDHFLPCGTESTYFMCEGFLNMHKWQKVTFEKSTKNLFFYIFMNFGNVIE